MRQVCVSSQLLSDLLDSYVCHIYKLLDVGTCQARENGFFSYIEGSLKYLSLVHEFEVSIRIDLYAHCVGGEKRVET